MLAGVVGRDIRQVSAALDPLCARTQRLVPAGV
jgi:hypothetical protein